MSLWKANTHGPSQSHVPVATRTNNIKSDTESVENLQGFRLIARIRNLSYIPSPKKCLFNNNICYEGYWVIIAILWNSPCLR